MAFLLVIQVYAMGRVHVLIQIPVYVSITSYIPVNGARFRYVIVSWQTTQLYAAGMAYVRHQIPVCAMWVIPVNGARYHYVISF